MVCYNQYTSVHTARPSLWPINGCSRSRMVSSYVGRRTVQLFEANRQYIALSLPWSIVLLSTNVHLVGKYKLAISCTSGPFVTTNKGHSGVVGAKPISPAYYYRPPTLLYGLYSAICRYASISNVEGSIDMKQVYNHHSL